MESADLALLAGKHILIVEGDHFAGAEVRGALEGAGAVLVGPVPSVAEGLAQIDDGVVDGAILDIRLDGETAFSIAERLRHDEIPFVFAAVYSDADTPPKYGGYRLCGKVEELAEIARALFAPPIIVS